MMSQKGQALTEYVVITAALLGVVSASVNYMLPDMVPDLINALEIHVRSYYFVITMPFP